MNIVGVAQTDIFSTCVFNNIVGVAFIFNSLFSLRSRLRSELNGFVSYPYIFQNFFASAPKYLHFLGYRGLPRAFCGSCALGAEPWGVASGACGGASPAPRPQHLAPARNFTQPTIQR